MALLSDSPEKWLLFFSTHYNITPQLNCHSGKLREASFSSSPQGEDVPPLRDR
jgi:hypothetical protein